VTRTIREQASPENRCECTLQYKVLEKIEKKYLFDDQLFISWKEGEYGNSASKRITRSSRTGVEQVSVILARGDLVLGTAPYYLQLFAVSSVHCLVRSGVAAFSPRLDLVFPSPSRRSGAARKCLLLRRVSGGHSFAAVAPGRRLATPALGSVAGWNAIRDCLG
jgi:hypothetical protein